MPNKLSQFWQELKRRKVVRIITVYAAASFVILELIDIVAPSLGLPDWTLNFIIILLCVGFIITVIISWVYDVTPEGGIVKTEPAPHEKSEDKPTSSKGWKIASYVSFVVIIVLIIFNIIPRSSRFNGRGGPDRSIAVIPFRNDSPEEEKMGFIDGTMEHILDNLSKIEDLRVVSRTSVEIYRDNPKPISVIAREMDVGYILEGSGQRDSDRIRITIQLLDATKDMHIWSHIYNREGEEVFDIQSEVGRLVAREVEAVINPDPDQVREESTPERQKAIVFYQEGMRNLNLYWENNESREFLTRAEELFHYSLVYDSTFIEPYQKLTEVYNEWRWNRYDDWEVMYDSAFVMANKAIQMGSQDSETHYYLGSIYKMKGQFEESLVAYKNAILYDPDNSRAYIGLADSYLNTDVIKSLEILYQALKRGSLSTRLYKRLHEVFRDYGFKELSLHYLNELTKLNDDSTQNNFQVSLFNNTYGDYQSTIELSLKVLAIDPLNRNQLEIIALTYMIEHQYDSSLVYYLMFESLDRGMWFPRWFGYTLIQNGEVAKGERYIEEDFVNYHERLDQGIVTPSNCLALGEIYAYRGENEKAFEQLSTLARQDEIDLFDLSFLRSPLWDNIRDEPQFKEIEVQLKAKYKAEHERVRQWLEENDIL